MKPLGLLAAGVILAGLVGALLVRARTSPSSRSEIRPPAPAMPAAAEPLAIKRAPTANVPEPELVARIRSGSGAPTLVKNLRLRLTYNPHGELVSFYNPAEYPTLDCVPLSSGQRASFAALRKISFTVLEKREKEQVEEANRGNFAPGALDRNGYHTVTVRSIQATVETPGGDTVVDTVQLPSHADALLVGDTAIGSYEKNLWGVTKPLVVEMGRAPAPGAPTR